MIRITNLGSGSAGNATLVEGGGVKILIDIGFSLREIEKRLRKIDTEPSSIDAIILTHEHTDHIKGVQKYMKTYRTPFYAAPECIQAARLDVTSSKFVFEIKDELFHIGDLFFEPIPLPHDAMNTLGYRFGLGSTSVGYAVDLGCVTNLLIERLRGCRVLFMESNHDIEMLRKGPYPWFLKQRIHGKHGHLSNDECAEALSSMVTDNTSHVVLSHMSETNNLPLLALKATRESLRKNDMGHVEVILTSQHGQSGTIEIDGC